MKRIILIRHGKSAWNNPNLSDHQRPLAERGLRDVPVMARRLQADNRLPELILSSSAVRAMQTTELLMHTLGYDSEKLIIYPSLYHASARQMLTVIKEQDDSFSTIALVGHNPGMNELIEEINPSFENLPTSGLYGIELSIRSWKETSFELMKTWFFDYPKKLR